MIRAAWCPQGSELAILRVLCPGCADLVRRRCDQKDQGYRGIPCDTERVCDMCGNLQLSLLA